MAGSSTVKSRPAKRSQRIQPGTRVQELSGERARGEVDYITRSGLLRVALDPEPCDLETEMRELAPWDVRVLGGEGDDGC